MLKNPFQGCSINRLYVRLYLTVITDHDVLIVFFKQGSTKDRVFAVYIYFTKHSDEEVCQKAITGLGKIIIPARVIHTGFSSMFSGIFRYCCFALTARECLKTCHDNGALK